MAEEGTPIRGKAFRVPDPTDAIPLSPDGYTTIENLPSSGGGIVTVIADDTDITVDAFHGTTIVMFTTVTGPHTVTLPPAAGVAQIVIVKDATGTATDTNSITALPAGVDELRGPSVIGSAPDGSFAVLQYTNDGATLWVSPLDDSVRLTTVNRNLVDLIASLGGTDGDGNVYSIEYDPDENPPLGLVCTTLDGTVSKAGVAPGIAVLTYVAPDGSTGDFGLGGNQFEFALNDADVNVVQCQGDTRADHGFFVQARNGDSSALHTLRVAQTGLELDGVVIDPAEPWPGG